MKRFYSMFSMMTLIAVLLFQPATTVNAQPAFGRGTPPPDTEEAIEQPVSRTNRVIVKYKEEAEASSGDERARAQVAASLSARVGVQMSYFRTMDDNVQVLELSERLPLDQVRGLSEQLMALPEVEYAEPDQVFQVNLVPNDPGYGEQWHYYGPYGINAPTAWNLTTGLTSTVVAVVDTGITNHVEFTGRTVPGYDFVSTALDGNDGDARDSNPSDPGDWITSAESNGSVHNGWFQGCAVSNSSWHGTHVAGTIAANSNNGVGVAGINWKANILPVRVLGKCGGYMSDIADGIRWAAGLSVSDVPANANPARVINVSIGGSGECSSTYQNAINSATAAGAIVVVSAGNENKPASESQPGNCNGVITVAATADDGYRAIYSNYGSMVEISAPGGDLFFGEGVLSTLNTGTTVPVADSYASYEGTSTAAPHVSGVVTLMLGRNPYLTSAEVLQILRNTATPFRSYPFPDQYNCSTSDCGAGIVNAYAALNATPKQTFADVSTSYWAWNFVERLSTVGITSGCGTGPVRYCPETTVTRDQMAVFLLRGIHSSSYNPPAVGDSTGFGDVPTTHWAAAWIKQLAAEGITGGCGGGNYCPLGPVTRAQMAVFLLKAKYGTAYTPPAVGGSIGFTDVPTTHWAAPWIKQLAAEGITGGCGAEIYCPEASVTRAQMAVFLVKTFNLP